MFHSVSLLSQAPLAAGPVLYRASCSEKVFGLYFCHFVLLINLYQSNYLSRECNLYKAIYLLLGDHVCEKSDAVNWIECP